MFARLSSIPSVQISMVALVVGFVLIVTGSVPLAVIGACLILFSFLLPFLRLGIKPNPPVARSERSNKAQSDERSSPTTVARHEDEVR